MSDKFLSDKVLVGPFRASFPYLMTKDPKTEKYSVSVLLPKDYDMAPLEAAVKAVLTKKYGADRKKWPTGLKLPFHLQDEKAQAGRAGYEEGAKYFNCWTYSAPQIIDRDRQEILDPDAIYPGVWLRAFVTAFWFSQSGNTGVSFFLGNVQKVRDDSRIDNRPKARDEFDDIPHDGDASQSGDSLFD